MKTNWIERAVESEIRAFNMPEDDENVYVEGYAVRFNSPSLIMANERFGIFQEIITPTAFRNADLSDVFAKDNHGKPFARVRNKTLELRVDDVGLYYKAKISKRNTQHMDMYEDIRSGLYGGSSFAFFVTPGGETFDRETRTRTINDIKVLRDVAPVYNPAYIHTTTEARSAFEMEIEEVRKARDRAESLERLAERVKKLQERIEA